MDCPSCKYPDSKVVYTRHSDRDDKIQRRRECLRCGMRFTTHEMMRAQKEKKFYEEVGK